MAPSNQASGNFRALVPVASKIALATAGARPTMGHSPAPADGRSLRSRMTSSIGGTSVKRGTRYCEKCGIRDAAVLEADGLEERAADALDDGALDLVAQAVGVDDGAALEGGDDAADPDAAPDGGRPRLRRTWRCSRPSRLPPAIPNPRPGAALRFAQPNLSAAASKTAFRRASERFFRRNASGSMPSACASSSMWLSRAKWFAVAASAR